MNTLILVVLALLAALAIAVIILFILLTKFPEKSQPLARWLMRFGPVRRRVEEQATEELSANPDQLIEAARQYGGRDMARAIEQQLAGKSEEETKALLDQAMKMAESGQTPTVSGAAAKSSSQAKRNKARAKRKAAKKQRKRR